MPPKSGTVPGPARGGQNSGALARHSPTRGSQNNESFAKAEFAEDVEASEIWSGETLSDEGGTTGSAVGVGAVVDWRIRGAG